MVAISRGAFAPLLMCATRSRLRSVQLLSAQYSVASPSLDEQAAYISAFRTRVAALNSAGPPSLPFFVGEVRSGEISHTILPVLEAHPDVFEVRGRHLRVLASCPAHQLIVVSSVCLQSVLSAVGSISHGRFRYCCSVPSSGSGFKAHFVLLISSRCLTAKFASQRPSFPLLLRNARQQSVQSRSG